MPKGDSYTAGAAYRLPREGAGAVASPMLRLFAHVVDAAALSAVPIATGDGRWYVGVFVVVNLLVLPVRWGTTVGKAAVRLRIVPLVDDEALTEQRGLTLTTALGRALSWACWPVVPLVAAFSYDEDRRTVLDRVTKTVVVEW